MCQTRPSQRLVQQCCPGLVSASMLFGVATIALLGFLGAMDRSEVIAAECEVTGFSIDEGCIDCCRRRLDALDYVDLESCSPSAGHIVRMTGSAIGPSFGAVSLAGLDVYVHPHELSLDVSRELRAGIMDHDESAMQFYTYSMAVKCGEAVGLKHYNVGDAPLACARMDDLIGFESIRASDAPACSRMDSDRKNSWSFENCTRVGCTRRQKCLYWPEESRVGLVEDGAPSTLEAQVLWMVITVIMCGLALFVTCVNVCVCAT